MSLLEIRNVTRRFSDFVAVDNVSISIEAGEFFTLLGPSGCGKTTLLRMIAGFDLPDQGQILLDGKDLVNDPPEKRPVHTVFQSYALFPHMTVAQNVAFPLHMANKSTNEIPGKVKEMLQAVHLEDKAGRYPHEMSGGQRQRVALARALINHPKVLLLDEPLAALDAKLREQMQLELINLQKEVGITFIYVTHDQSEALALSSRIAIMNKGQVEQLDEPDKIYSFPKSRFVADFIGTCNLLDGKISQVSGNLIKLDIPGIGSVSCAATANAEAGKAGSLALRPEQIRIRSQVTPNAEENHFRGEVKDYLYLGDVTIYIVELEGGTKLEALLANSSSGLAKFFEIGDKVEVAWRFDAGHFLES